MDRFLTCLVDEDYSALVISGKADHEELKQVWVIILSEYYELKGAEINGDEQTKLSVEFTRLNDKLKLAQRCIDFLVNSYSESIANSLCKLGYRFKPALKHPDYYIEDLHRVAQRAKTDYVRMQQISKQLEILIKKIPEKIDPTGFENTLNSIEEMQGAAYDFSSLTVSRFVALENKLIRYIDTMKAKTAKHGN